MYKITSRFGDKEGFRDHAHTGYDFLMKDGTPLRSIQDGKIEKILTLKDNVGKAVLIKWEDGKTAIYGHMSEINSSLHVGDTVHTGDLLGYSGHSGTVFSSSGGNGAHLHFGLKNPQGEFIDSAEYIEHIQNMNNPEMLAKLTDIPDKIEKSASLLDLFNSTPSIYSDLFRSLKLNLIQFFQSIDYTVFVQYLQNLFQFFS